MSPLLYLFLHTIIQSSLQSKMVKSCECLCMRNYICEGLCLCECVRAFVSLKCASVKFKVLAFGNTLACVIFKGVAYLTNVV